MGKTGTMHAWEQEGIRGPDIQAIGKALGGGFIPLSAVLLHQNIFDTLAKGTGVLAHGHTFQVSTLCGAAPSLSTDDFRTGTLCGLRGGTMCSKGH